MRGVADRPPPTRTLKPVALDPSGPGWRRADEGDAVDLRRVALVRRKSRCVILCLRGRSK